MLIRRVLYLKYSRIYLLTSLPLFIIGTILGFMFRLYSTAFVMQFIGMLLFVYTIYTACVEENISKLNIITFLVTVIISTILALTMDIIWKIRDPVMILVPSWIIWMSDFPFMIARCSRLYNMYIKQKRKIKTQ